MIWTAIAAAVAIPLLFAVTSPLLQWREPVYIAAGFSGVVAMGLLLVQPLLVGGFLPGVQGMTGRRAHRSVGVLLVAAVSLHVIGLWITSPPDVVDALLFMSPTPFSVWGVVAMWALFAAAALGMLRKQMGTRLRLWRALHTGCVAVVVLGTVVHVLRIEGTMEPVSKAVLAGLILVALIRVLLARKVWSVFSVSRQG